jgi:hypothetical protein
MPTSWYKVSNWLQQWRPGELRSFYPVSQVSEIAGAILPDLSVKMVEQIPPVKSFILMGQKCLKGFILISSFYCFSKSQVHQPLLSQLHLDLGNYSANGWVDIGSSKTSNSPYLPLFYIHHVLYCVYYSIINARDYEDTDVPQLTMGFVPITPLQVLNIVSKKMCLNTEPTEHHSSSGPVLSIQDTYVSLYLLGKATHS